MNARARQTIALIRVLTLGRQPRRRRVLPRQHPPLPIEREYAAALLERLAVVRRAFAPLLAELPALLAGAAAARRVDVDEGKRARVLVAEAERRLADAVTDADLERLATEFFRKTATYQRVQLNRQVRAALGADPFLADRALPALLDGFVAENVALIKSIPAQVAAKVEQATTRAIQNATRHENVAKELNSIFDFGEDRAKLIARDQVGKAYGQINAQRQKELGAEEFIWRTVQDERVRDEHVAREGARYRYSDPPDGELPGEPILCRCYAEPVFTEMSEAL